MIIDATAVTHQASTYLKTNTVRNQKFHIGAHDAATSIQHPKGNGGFWPGLLRSDVGIIGEDITITGVVIIVLRKG